LWLIDNLSPTGAIQNPQIHETNKARELSDLLLTYPGGTFLFESKTLAILDRSELPSRQKLARNITKHILKATNQLIGGINNLRRGYPITDKGGKELPVERKAPPHVIVLVPDLSLLSNAIELGGDYFQNSSKRCGGFFHILDLVELLRIVQAAEMISKQSFAVTKMMAFDYYLLERSKRANTVTSPYFQILLRSQNQCDAES
jgi:hypothetical protein